MSLCEQNEFERRGKEFELEIVELMDFSHRSSPHDDVNLIHTHNDLVNIYLGNSTAAINRNWLLSSDIVAIINCAEEIPPKPPSIPPSLAEKWIYHKLEMDDGGNMNKDKLMKEIKRAAEAIAEAVEEAEKIAIHSEKKAGVFIHCAAGQSRSAFILICYFISQNFTAKEAFLLVKRGRRFIYPNSQFCRSLLSFELLFHPINSLPPSYISLHAESLHPSPHY